MQHLLLSWTGIWKCDYLVKSHKKSMLVVVCIKNLCDETLNMYLPKKDYSMEYTSRKWRTTGHLIYQKGVNPFEFLSFFGGQGRHPSNTKINNTLLGWAYNKLHQQHLHHQHNNHQHHQWQPVRRKDPLINGLWGKLKLYLHFKSCPKPYLVDATKLTLWH